MMTDQEINELAAEAKKLDNARAYYNSIGDMATAKKYEDEANEIWLKIDIATRAKVGK